MLGFDSEVFLDPVKLTVNISHQRETSHPTQHQSPPLLSYVAWGPSRASMCPSVTQAWILEAKIHLQDLGQCLA